MQSAKDTFLLALRDRLAVVNPARTVAVRGAVRPAVIATDVEMPVAKAEPMDCFVLRWMDESVDRSEPLPLHAMQCEVAYATRGTQELSGMDRGRVLSAMDFELEQILEPRWIVLRDFSGTSVVVMTTRVWWSEEAKFAVTAHDDSLRRVVTVTVLALEEVTE